MILVSDITSSEPLDRHRKPEAREWRPRYALLGRYWGACLPLQSREPSDLVASRSGNCPLTDSEVKRLLSARLRGASEHVFNESIGEKVCQTAAGP